MASMDHYQQMLTDLASDLVRIPTINFPPDGDEAPGQARLRAFYEALGLEIDQFSPADLPEYPSHPEFLPRNLVGRENLVGVWRGTGGGKSVLITGHMDVVPIEPLPWTVTLPFEPRLKGGKLYGLAVTSGKRVGAAPDVPTLKEAGVPLEILLYSGIMGPKGMPPALVERLGAEIRKALASPEMKQTLANVGAEDMASTPAEFVALTKVESEKMATAVKIANVVLD